MKDNGNVCLCVTSHQSFDVIQQFLNPDVKSTIFCLILSFIFLLSNINDLITYGCFMNLLSSFKHIQPRLLWRIMKLLCLCHNFCVNFCVCVCVITFVFVFVLQFHDVPGWDFPPTSCVIRLRSQTGYRTFFFPKMLNKLEITLFEF